MKRIYNFLLTLFALTLLLSCDEGFEEVNVDPTRSTDLNPVFLFSNAQLSSSLGANTIIYESAIVQHTMHPFLGVIAGGNVNQRNDNNTQSTWNQFYSTVIKPLSDVIAQTQDDPARSNLYNMARIWRGYAISILSDSYGDVPYTEAGLGFLEAVTLPKYDAQQEIYRNLIAEIEQATNALDATKTIEGGDLFYKGNIAQWKKLGFSLMLRLGMRLTKADAALAQSTVQKAFAGGVMLNSADNCLMRHSSTYNNPVSGLLTSTERANFYLHETFLNYLKSQNDPRLGVISILYGNPGLTPTDAAQTENTDPAMQLGMPMGFDNITLPKAPGFPGTAGAGYKYSQINRRSIADIDAPCFFITAGQTQLLLAEAAQRGWISGQALEYYRAGIRAHMDQFKEYDAISAIPASAISAFADNANLTGGSELDNIATQYWVASFLNAPEAFANWRRTGFPVLAPNPYPAKDIKGDFIRRLNYPPNERAVNVENYNAAVQRQGPDDLETRVWWDK